MTASAPTNRAHHCKKRPTLAGPCGTAGVASSLQSVATQAGPSGTAGDATSDKQRPELAKPALTFATVSIQVQTHHVAPILAAGTVELHYLNDRGKTVRLLGGASVRLPVSPTAKTSSYSHTSSSESPARTDTHVRSHTRTRSHSRASCHTMPPVTAQPIVAPAIAPMGLTAQPPPTQAGPPMCFNVCIGNPWGTAQQALPLPPPPPIMLPLPPPPPLPAPRAQDSTLLTIIAKALAAASSDNPQLMGGLTPKTPPPAHSTATSRRPEGMHRHSMTHHETRQVRQSGASATGTSTRPGHDMTHHDTSQGRQSGASATGTSTRHGLDPPSAGPPAPGTSLSRSRSRHSHRHRRVHRRRRSSTTPTP